MSISIKAGLIPSLLLSGCITVYADPPKAPSQKAAPATAPAQWDGATIADTIQKCEAVQKSQDVKMGCKFDYVAGKPTIVVTFPSDHYSDNVSAPVAEHLGAPFCKAANNASREAYFMMIFADTQLARLFSCETGEASEPFSLAK